MSSHNKIRPTQKVVGKPVKTGAPVRRHFKKAHPHHGARNGRAPGTLNHVDNPLDNRDGTMCLMPGHAPAEVAHEPLTCDPNDQESGAMEVVVNKINALVDNIDGLQGSGVVLQLPESDPMLLRPPSHASELDTYVVATLEAGAAPPPEQGWYDKWNGVIWNCGGAAISWGGIAVGAAAEIPSLGTSSALVVVGYAGAAATTAQCGLAVAKITSSHVNEFINGPNGWTVDVADVLLDIVSLAGGIAGAANALRSGSKLLNASKYASLLNETSKGTLLKQLGKLEKAGEDVSYIKELFKRTIDAEKVFDPAARKFSNNLLKRALPYITKQLRNEVLVGLANAIGGAMSTVSSAYGGSGPRNLGLVKFSIQILQETIAWGESKITGDPQPAAPAQRSVK